MIRKEVIGKRQGLNPGPRVVRKSTLQRNKRRVDTVTESKRNRKYRNFVNFS